MYNVHDGVTIEKVGHVTEESNLSIGVISQGGEGDGGKFDCTRKDFLHFCHFISILQVLGFDFTTLSLT